MASSAAPPETADFRMSALMLLARGRPPSERHVESTARKTSVLPTILLLWILATAVKVLLWAVPYFSTDLYVHRHWKAVTRHLEWKDWYFDDKFVKTTHTVDYPPLFMLFESVLARLLPEHCTRLLNDTDLETSLDPSCIVHMRATVVLADIVFWVGSCLVCTAYNQSLLFPWTKFLLLVFHPALLFLDHVHFQYNGMLLGILLIGLYFLMQNKLVYATISFGVLVSCKHLYITSLPWFAVVIYAKTQTWTQRLSLLSVLILTGLLPLLPFLLATDDPVLWLQQVLSRLFPFQRGLVHSYWAGNVWVFYMIGCKILSKLQITSSISIPVTPVACGILTVFCELPGLRLAYHSSSSLKQSRRRTVGTDYRQHRMLILSFVYVNLVNFLFQYHGHEKAILTALLPSLLLLNDNLNLWDFHATALVSLFPLLFEKTELLLKLGFSIAYLSALHAASPTRTSVWTMIAVADVVFVLDILDVSLFGKYEFAPLALTSLVCSVCYVSMWFHLRWAMTTVDVKN